MLVSEIERCEEAISPRYCLVRPAGRDLGLQKEGSPKMICLKRPIIILNREIGFGMFFPPLVYPLELGPLSTYW